jgi:N-acyl-L-homoserine lactone synthetase
MLRIINGTNEDLIPKVHQLRRKVFKERLNWDVTIINGMEFDEFDTDDAQYILLQNKASQVVGCARLVPTVKPYLLGNVFPNLIEGPVIRSQKIWEISRFAVDQNEANEEATALLLIGILEFGISRGLSHYVSMSDTRVEPVLRNIGWSPKRLGASIYTGTERSVGEIFEVSSNVLNEIRSKLSLENQKITVQHLPEFSEEARMYG